MPDINVSFVHPIDGRIMNVVVDDGMTAQEMIDELLANDFVSSHSQGYQLSVIESGNILTGTQTLAGAGVSINSKIKVLPVMGAG